MENNYDQLYGKISQLQWLLQRQHMLKNMEHGPLADATRGQGRVLAVLKIKPEISTKDLSYLLGIRVPSLNELLNKLEKGGYILRKPSETDKRVINIHLTEKGKATQQEEIDYSIIFDCLDENEQEKFGEYLDRIIKVLEEQVVDSLEQEKDEMERWMQAARSRMGNEQFENFMSLKNERFNRGFGRGHGPFGRGKPFGKRHDAGPFDRNYDGPMPREHKKPDFGKRPEHDDLNAPYPTFEEDK